MVLCHELLVTLSPAPIKRKNTRSFWQRRCFAGFAAETQAPIMMAHQTKLSPTACTAALRFGALLRSNGCKLPASHLNVYRSNDIARATASSTRSHFLPSRKTVLITARLERKGPAGLPAEAAVRNRRWSSPSLVAAQPAAPRRDAAAPRQCRDSAAWDRQMGAAGR